MIKERTQTIDRLTDLDNTKRMLKRGSVALENITAAHSQRTRQNAVELKSKRETIRTLEANQQDNLQRHQVQQEMEQDRRNDQMSNIRSQIEEKKKRLQMIAQRERAEHLRDLQIQEAMFQQRAQNMEDHLRTIQDRDNMINAHFSVSSSPALTRAARRNPPW